MDRIFDVNVKRLQVMRDDQNHLVMILNPHFFSVILMTVKSEDACR